MSKKQLAILCSLLAAALILPFLAGQFLAGREYVFGGFLLNPLDGNSYLAKMRLGLQGGWRFTLPYTVDPGEGAYLFLFYILLGHLARISGIGLPLMFHLGRILASGFLVFALYRYVSRSVKSDFRIAFGLIAALLFFGSGLGWIAGLFGAVTSDFWVAEAYPFLSMYANPHFPLGLGLGLVYLDLLQNSGFRYRWAPGFILLGAVTAVIQPFVVVVCAVLTAIYVVWNWLAARRSNIWLSIFFFAGAGGLLLYQYLAIVNDPILSAWNAQNITASPPFWDFLISFSPALILAVVGLIGLVRSKSSTDYKILIAWLIAGVILAYIPFALQRRFLLGYFIPCTVLAGVGITYLAAGRFRLQRMLGRLVLALSVVTNVFVLTGGVLASTSHDPRLFLTKDEKSALDWMAANPDEAGLTLASEQMGMLIPAYSGWRVLYGHPFETINAKQREAEINAIFGGTESQTQIAQYMVRENVKYVFWSQRERAFITNNPFAGYEMVYQNATVTIYATGAAN